MTEDLRQFRLLLVSHRVLNQTTLPRVAHSSDGESEVTTSVVDWAHAEGHGVYQLPVPDYYFEEQTAPDRPERREADRSALAFVASQLQVYVENGYSVVGVVLLAEDSADPRETAWVDDLLAALAAIGITGLPLWQAPRVGVISFDPAAPSAIHPLAVSVAP